MFLVIIRTGDKKMKKIGLILSTFLFILSGCKTEKTLNRYQAQSMSAGFDTVMTLIAYSESEEEFGQYFKFMVDEFIRYNALFDKYNDYEGVNNIKTINDNAGKQPVEVDEDLIEMLLLSKEFSQLSNNQFDITMGPVLEIWHNYRDAGLIAMENGEPTQIPTTEELEQAKACVGWENVEIDEEKNTVYLTQECASLDVGSVAKGFATEKIAQELIEKGLTSGIINAGGNLRSLGNKPDGSGWNSGIQDPTLLGSSETIGIIPVSNNQSFVTSGDYQRFYLYDKQIMHHIIDPSTLFPARHARSISIVTDNSAIADICSTTLYTLPYEEAVQLIDKIKELGYNLEAVWVFDENTEMPKEAETFITKGYTMTITDGLKDIFIKQ